MQIPPHLLDIASSKFLKKNEHYVIEGQKVNTIAYVVNGYLRSYQIDYKGDDVTTNLFAPNSFCGAYYGFYAKQPSIENIVAITDVEIKVINYEKLMSLYEGNLELNVLGRKIVENICVEKDIRISKLLQLDAKNRYLWFLEEYPELVLNVPIKYIASFLGMKKETISRIRKKLT